MMIVYLLGIVLASLAGGAIPLFFRNIHKSLSVYLLAFTGAFLFGITIIHLMPETFEALGREAGIYVVAGFFIQVFLQQLSHGLEHGHSHVAGAHGGHVAISGLLTGLSVHAFMEGIPLGFHFRDPATLPALALGVLAHKLPEALTLMTVLVHTSSHRKKNAALLLLFTAMTPLAALFAHVLGTSFAAVSQVLLYIVALVIGAFLHISTTIFFESGTRQHELNRGKAISMIIGLLLACATLLLE